MESLAIAWSGATETSARTAKLMGPCCSDIFKFGRLVITTVSLRDGGLKGRGEQELAPQTEFVPDPEAVFSQQQLGLPISFGKDVDVRQSPMRRACMHAPSPIDGSSTIIDVGKLRWQNAALEAEGQEGGASIFQ